jgi:hypothetical protein
VRNGGSFAVSAHLFSNPKYGTARRPSLQKIFLSLLSNPPQISRMDEPGRRHPAHQRDFWDTQLRRSENYTEKWQYVLRNPVRAKLVENVEDWPYQGELNILPW